MKKLALLIVFIVINVISFGQTVQKTFYLKNGSIIKGVVIEEIPGKEYKVKTSDGNIFVFKADEIKKITLEDSTNKPKSKESELTDKLTFYNLNELSVGAMIEEDASTYNFGVSSINGITLNNQLSLGVGVELQLTGIGNFVPIYSDIRFNFSKTPKTFFTFLNAGVAISGRTENVEVVEPAWNGGFNYYSKPVRYQNGFYGRLGFGYKTNITEKLNASISLFYTAHSYEASAWLYDQIYFNTEGIYSVIGVRFGIGFNKKLK